MKLFKFILAAIITLFVCQPTSAKKIKVHVEPDNATIFVNGEEVGNGIYEVNLGRNEDFAVLKFTAPGYLDRTVKLFKKNPKKQVSYKLFEDEARKQSLGASDGVDVANKFFSVTCRKGMTDDVVWKRLMNIAVSNFENVEIRDKAAGWIRTAWAQTKFTNQIVRTRLEIRLQFTGEDELAYKVRLSSEISEDINQATDDSFEKYDRVLKQYESVITELQTTLGSDL